ncbi:glycoside hydrolase family protein [Chroococcus sp. FPU101]|uniref:glycoside hydrolase family 24 protein n=1 Tax=Chroococcus sp. FPU101 TaxID=1974212 RepID=UPI001A8E60CE|nr:glycoside hydrolase family protein [Chroococcus sp. FPU101]GFE67416.1 glycoside hydrolase family 24 [Chroococcus sp. FPU101]
MSNRQTNFFAKTLFGLSILTLLAFQGRLPAFVNTLTQQFSKSMLESSYLNQPLAMTGGDPYIRALMRTITASESNVTKPYYVLYGGKYVADLSKHPEQCMPILVGPNIGQCSTAAGRYQFLNTTWYEKAQKYHPRPSGVLWWKNYSFEPEYQDRVVYAWLNDQSAWGVNISQKLQQGKIEAVLKLLSPTWTSLGYGIETNSMSPHLSRIYQKMLTEELKRVG